MLFKGFQVGHTAFCPTTGLLALRQFCNHTVHDVNRYLILQIEYIFKLPVVSLAPNVTTRYCIDKLNCDPHFIIRLLDTPLQHILHA